MTQCIAHLLICIILLVSFLSQSATALTGSEGIAFHDASSGLTQYTVTSIVQDRAGFLWIGTQYGLNRYDGLSYVHYEHSEDVEQSISRSRITSLCYDEVNDFLWIGTYGGGLDLLELQTGKFQHFNSANQGLSNDYVTDIHLDDSGLVWVATEKGGLNLLEAATGKTLTNIRSFHLNQVPYDYITAIEGQEDELLLGTWQNGLLLVDLSRGTVQQIDVEGGAVRSLVRYGESGYLVGTNAGLLSVYVEQGQLKKASAQFGIPEATVILSLLVDDDGRLLIGTENKGLYIQNPDGRLEHHMRRQERRSPINGNSVWSMFQDRSGIIWLGFYLKGLCKIDPLQDKFSTIQGFRIAERQFELELVSALLEDRQGKMWIGTDGFGLFRLDPETWHFEEQKIWGKNSNLVVTSLLEDQAGNIWVGTWQEGIKLIKTDASVDSEPVLETILEGAFIHSLANDDMGNVWASSFGSGIFIFDAEGKSKFLGTGELISTKVTVISKGCDSDMLIGTEESGVQALRINTQMEIEQSQVFHSNKGKELVHDAVNDLLIDRDCTVWIASSGGLLRRNAGSDMLVKYTRKHGLPSNLIASVECDDLGLIWASTNKGVFSLDPGSLEVRSFQQSDGLSSNEFSKEASVHLSNGEIAFGNVKGLDHTNARAKEVNQLVPDVYITKVEISGRSLEDLQARSGGEDAEEPEVNLRFDQNDISFDFTSLNFTQSNKNCFRVRLLGFEEEWRDIGHDRKQHYNNLLPGKYTFEVLGSNNELLWNEKPAKFSFRVCKAWYDSNFAWFCYLLALGSLIYLGMRNFLTRARLQHDLALEQIEVEKMKEMDRMKSKLFANISHEFLTPLSLIISPIKGHLSQSSQHLARDSAEMILRNAERLKKYINQILSLAKLESGHYQIRVRKQNFARFLADFVANCSGLAAEKAQLLDLDLPTENIQLYYDEEKMEQIFANLISNAIKYTPREGSIIVSLTQDAEYIEIKVTDSGKGIAPEHLDQIFDRFFRERNENEVTGTGIGLSITRQLVQLHGGQISASSPEEGGTCFQVKLRKGHAHFKAEQIEQFPLGQVNELQVQQEPSYDLSYEAPATEESTNKDLPHILVVEDNPDIRTYLRQVLAPEYQVHLAPNGKVGLDLAMQLIPDLIISDVMMPEMNGYQLVDKLKSQELTNHIAIILLTVKSSEESQVSGYSKGADYYMTKPFNPSLLMLRIRNILNYRDKQFARRNELEDVEQEAEKESQSIGLSELDLNFLSKVDQVIDEHLGDSQFKVQDLNQALGYSKSQLYRKLKAITGKSVNEYIRGRRLSRAAKLLLETQLNISEVTYKVGFNDLPYFRKCFKAEFGQNPSEFAKKNQSGIT